MIQVAVITEELINDNKYFEFRRQDIAHATDATKADIVILETVRFVSFPH